jgi:hypothetical protein
MVFKWTRLNDILIMKGIWKGKLKIGSNVWTGVELKLQSGRSLSTLLASVTQRGLKRVGSATNLAPPGMDGTTGGSISLPPSPNHSPSPSRKVPPTYFQLFHFYLTHLSFLQGTLYFLFEFIHTSCRKLTNAWCMAIGIMLKSFIF